MEKIARMGVDFTEEERNLFSVAFKNQIGNRKESLKNISSKIEQDSKLNVVFLSKSKEYKKKIEDEYQTICGNVLHLLNEYLIPNTTAPESIVFYYKMSGDYSRYGLDVDSSNEALKTQTRDYYAKATELLVVPNHRENFF